MRRSLALLRPTRPPSTSSLLASTSRALLPSSSSSLPLPLLRNLTTTSPLATPPRPRGRPRKDASAPPLPPNEPVQKEVIENNGGRKRIQLRPYQLDCVEAVLDTLREGEFTRLGVSAPTGSGKTAIFTSLIHRLPPVIHPYTGNSANRVLILVGSVVLAQQAAETVKRTYPDLSVELEQGGNTASGLADVTVATYQTLARGNLTRLEKFNPNHYKAVIIDEAHHSVAKSYLSILSRFDSRITSEAFATELDPIPEGAISPASISPSPFHSNSHSSSSSPSVVGSLGEADDPEPEPPVQAQVDEEGNVCVPLLAFTATWGRADGLALGTVFQKVVWHADWLDMIRASWLAQLKFTAVKLGDSLDIRNVNVSSSTGEFVMKDLAKAVDKSEVNKLAVEAWMTKAEGSRSTLVFAVNIEHIVSLTNAFRDQGVDARFVHEGIPMKERERLYEEFRKGTYPVLVNCGILTEGADFPAIDCILLARPTRSQNLFLQMIGRGLRQSPETNKQHCLIIDLVGNATDGLVCTPTLFGINPLTTLEDQTTDQLTQIAAKEQSVELERLASSPAPNPLFRDYELEERGVQYTDYDTVFDLVADKNGPRPVSKMSRLAWLGTGDDVWVLELPGKGYMRIGRNKLSDTGTYDASFYRRLPPEVRFNPNPYARPQHLASHPNLEILLRTVERKMMSTSEMKPDKIDITRNAPWRKSKITPAQRERVLKKIGIRRAKVVEEEEEPLEEGEEEVEEPELLLTDEIDGVWIGRRSGVMIKIDEVNRGQAADIISRLQHGGLTQLKKRENRVKREKKKEEKLRNKMGKVLGKKGGGGGKGGGGSEGAPAAMSSGSGLGKAPWEGLRR